MIESLSFGRMVVAGNTYNSDLIIFPDGRIQDNWWRQSGHRLTLADVADLMVAAPEAIVVGTGVYGYMKPDRDIPKALKRQGIGYVAEPTGQAWKIYNDLAHGTRVGACFHVGC